MLVELKPHQKPVIDQIHNGCVLIGGVGSGKTVTSLAYCWIKEFGGVLGDMGSAKTPTDIYVFTTARKRDSQDWQNWAMRFGISIDPKGSVTGTRIVVESYNNMTKYDDVTGAFVIFDEQRVVGSGAWSKSFIKIAKQNRWIMLSATPGDVPEDYIPLFIANGFYKNRSEFKREHCVYSYYGRFPKLERYLNMRKFERLRDSILVDMPYEKHTKRHIHEVPVEYDKELFDRVVKRRWHVYEDRPLKDVSELFSVMRKVVNSDKSRLEVVTGLLRTNPRLIVFYNFDYELEMLRTLANVTVLTVPTPEALSKSKTESTDETLANISVRGTMSSSRKSLGTSVGTGSTTNTMSHISENNSSDWFLKNPNRSETPYSTGSPKTGVTGGPTDQAKRISETESESYYLKARESTNPPDPKSSTSTSSLSSCRTTSEYPSSLSSDSGSSSGSQPDLEVAEWNGHKHEEVPESSRWAYLVQYVAGAEAWNCTTTNAVAFWSRTYSYKNEQQAMGRIDRLDKPFVNLHYYFLMSKASIDRAIARSLTNKQNFNERKFLGK